MRFKTKIKLAVASATAITVVGTVIVVREVLRRRRVKQDRSFMSDEVRVALEDLCTLKGEDFVPDRIGTSLYQRRLASLTDRQLVGVYVMIKLGEALHKRGVDIHQLSRQEILAEAVRVHKSVHQGKGRQELLRALGSIGAEAARSMLGDGLMLAGVALQAA